MSDIGKLVLNNVSVTAAETEDEWSSVIVHGKLSSRPLLFHDTSKFLFLDLGLSYEYDEHFAISHPSNVIHQVDLHSQLLPYQIRAPDLSKTGILDDSLWEKPAYVTDSEAAPVLESSPHGEVVDFTADIIEPEQLCKSDVKLESTNYNKTTNYKLRNRNNTGDFCGNVVVNYIQHCGLNSISYEL